MGFKEGKTLKSINEQSIKKWDGKSPVLGKEPDFPLAHVSVLSAMLELHGHVDLLRQKDDRNTTKAGN